MTFLQLLAAVCRLVRFILIGTLNHYTDLQRLLLIIFEGNFLVRNQINYSSDKAKTRRKEI